MLRSFARLARQTWIHYEEQRLAIRGTNLTLTTYTRTETRSAIKTMNSCLLQGVEVWSIPKEDKLWVLKRSRPNYTLYLCSWTGTFNLSGMTFKKKSQKIFRLQRRLWLRNGQKWKKWQILQWSRTVKITVENRTWGHTGMEGGRHKWKPYPLIESGSSSNINKSSSNNTLRTSSGVKLMPKAGYPLHLTQTDCCYDNDRTLKY